MFKTYLDFTQKGRSPIIKPIAVKSDKVIEGGKLVTTEINKPIRLKETLKKQNNIKFVI